MFTNEQLQLIEKTARKSKNQGELAVFDKIDGIAVDHPTDWIASQLDVIEYCAQECKRQHSGELSVYDMVNAWDYADTEYWTEWTPNSTPNLRLNFIEHLGKLVEPIDNKKGFRTIPIFVGNRFEMHEKAPWERVPTLLEMLLDSYYIGILATDALDADNGQVHYSGWNRLSKSAEDQFYFEYENIHPFVDGNGRSGKIIYNYLKGTLDNPQMPPNFWGSSNP